MKECGAVIEGEKGAAGVRVDDVGITCPGARAIPAIFNLFQVPFRGGEKKGAAVASRRVCLSAQRDTSIPHRHRHLFTLHLTRHDRSRGFFADTAILRFQCYIRQSSHIIFRISATASSPLRIELAICSFNKYFDKCENAKYYGATLLTLNAEIFVYASRTCKTVRLDSKNSLSFIHAAYSSNAINLLCFLAEFRKYARFFLYRG